MAVKVLRAFQDQWLKSDAEFPCKSTVAVILNIFSFDFFAAGFINYKGISADDLAQRSVKEWLALVGTPEAECSRLAPHKTDSECNAVVHNLCLLLSRAADSWGISPLEPPCEQVAQGMTDLLVSSHFVTIIYG